MKKISFFAVATLAVVLMGCSSKNTNTPQFDTTKLWPALQGEKYGFIDPQGKFAIPAMYDGVSNFSCGYARVRIGNDIKFIDTNNKMLNTPAMDYAEPFYNKYAKFRVDGKYGLLDNSGNTVIQPYFEELGYMGDNGLVAGAANKEDLIAFYDKDAKVVLPAMYNYAEMFQDGAAVVELNQQMGAIDKSGKWLIPASYGGLINFGHGLLAFFQNSRFGLLDLNGNTIAQPIYTNFIVPVDNELIAVTTSSYEEGDSEPKWGYIDFKGNQVLAAMYYAASPFFEGYACVRMSEEAPYSIIDTKGNVVLTLAKNEYPETGLHNGLFLTGTESLDEESFKVVYQYKDIKGSVVYTWSEKYDYYAPERRAMKDHGKAFIEKTLR